jgi:hypothetical protein
MGQPACFTRIAGGIERSFLNPVGGNEPVVRREIFNPNQGEHAMSKSQDAKKNTKKAPTKTPKEKKEAKRLKKAERKH